MYVNYNGCTGFACNKILFMDRMTQIDTIGPAKNMGIVTRIVSLDRTTHVIGCWVLVTCRAGHRHMGDRTCNHWQAIVGGQCDQHQIWYSNRACWCQSTIPPKQQGNNALRPLVNCKHITGLFRPNSVDEIARRILHRPLGVHQHKAHHLAWINSPGQGC